ncbi:OsmC family protein [Caulobacter sp. S45]|uniref:OsmC family protein n=1 Tax=Caulobacter sp. S45 TaxID=1641861 RepID=UPI00131E5785|nr:OsmC family protein [Caulobacter sp. S45]
MDTPPDQPAPPPRTGVVRVAETRRSPLQVEIQAGPSRFFADEPVSVGGMDTGPTPHELVSAGLGACTAMTMRMYADRKGWPVERIEVDVAESRAAGGPTRFERTIRLHGALDEAQRARLLEIAERCPVHRTLSEGAKIETRLEAGANA